ncbi:hypothetical protein CAEBREN_02797 [Caenorhabditis brenneri]|uniref:DUF38 domain-containing protein n=1 Tax=Caenorhabditis brenneri TaxID=135651 RepID=G0P2Q1_CAEBE|nr:hypothetical protein CAEBREN_02797 [Caenorhabditis brenneri]
MSCNPHDDFHKQLCIRHAFNSDFPPYFAFSHTRNSFPLVTLKEVKKLYEQFKKERLHNTSLGLSSFVSNSYKSYEEIQVFLTDTDISLKIKEQESDAISSYQLGKKRKLEESEDSNEIRSLTDVNEALSLLKSIFESTKTKIGSLSIKYDKDMKEKERKQQFHEALLNIFNELKSDIHVEKLTIAVKNQDQLKEVLEKMKVGPLTELNISNCFTKYPEPFPMDEICLSGHWKNIRVLFGTHLILDLPLNKLINIQRVVTAISPLSVEQIVNHKNALLKSPNNFAHFFVVTIPEGLMDAMKPFNPPKDITKKNTGTYRRENNTTLHFTAEKNELLFETV